MLIFKDTYIIKWQFLVVEWLFLNVELIPSIFNCIIFPLESVDCISEREYWLGEETWVFCFLFGISQCKICLGQLESEHSPWMPRAGASSVFLGKHGGCKRRQPRRSPNGEGRPEQAACRLCSSSAWSLASAPLFLIYLLLDVSFPQLGFSRSGFNWTPSQWNPGMFLRGEEAAFAVMASGPNPPGRGWHTGHYSLESPTCFLWCQHIWNKSGEKIVTCPHVVFWHLWYVYSSVMHKGTENIHKNNLVLQLAVARQRPPGWHQGCSCSGLHGKVSLALQH
jgi:hypothetical protein